MFDKGNVSFGEILRLGVKESEQMPSPRADELKANAVMKIPAAATIADSCKKRQRVNNPAVRISRFRLVLVEVDELAGIVVNKELIVESEVGKLACEKGNVLAPNLFIIGTNNGGRQFEMEVVVFGSIIANPADAARIVVEELGERIDERILPPAVFHKFGKSVLPVNGAVKDFAV